MITLRAGGKAFNLAAWICILVSPAAVYAQSATSAYPVKPLRLIVPFPPGSGVDIVTRIVAPSLGAAMGQQLVVENRSGAGGIVGAEIAAKAPADGYNLFMGTAGVLTVAPVLSRVSYSVARDFAPISLIASVPSMLVVHPTMPATSLKGLVALARAKPGFINYASTGNGTLPHLAAEFFKLQAKIEIVHVPYKGSAPALTDLLGGQVDMFFGNMLSVMPQVSSAKLRALAVTSPLRSPVAPDTPTVAESGYPGFEAGTWFGILAPAAAPKEIVAKLHAEIVKVLRRPDVRLQLASQGASAIGAGPEAFAAHINSEAEKWGKVLKASGVKAQ